MKKLIALLAVACVSLVSCSETLDADDLNGIMKKFDFSEVDTDNLQGIREETNFSTPESTVFTGVLNDCLWIGVFDSESGSLQCQYTDEDHPTSYFAYGEEYKYEVGEVLDAYFERNRLIIVIKYADSQYNNSGRAVLSSRKDLISVTGDSHCRYVLDEKSSYSSVSIMKWTKSGICILLGKIAIIYDIDNDKILCKYIEDSYLTGGFIDYLHDRIKDNNTCNNLMISTTNILHFWNVHLEVQFLTSKSNLSYEGNYIQFKVKEYQCTYDTIHGTSDDIFIFNPNIDDLSKIPRYSAEYKVRTDDHIVFVATQTEYDGTVTTKTVDIRVENDELKVDIQE